MAHRTLRFQFLAVVCLIVGAAKIGVGCDVFVGFLGLL